MTRDARPLVAWTVLALLPGQQVIRRPGAYRVEAGSPGRWRDPLADQETLAEAAPDDRPGPAGGQLDRCVWGIAFKSPWAMRGAFTACPSSRLPSTSIHRHDEEATASPPPGDLAGFRRRDDADAVSYKRDTLATIS